MNEFVIYKHEIDNENRLKNKVLFRNEIKKKVYVHENSLEFNLG